MAALEAQAAGIPSLLSDGIPSIVDVGAGLATFLPCRNAQIWANAIIAVKDHVISSNQTIVDCFDKKGYNSVTMVKEIENKYIALCQY